MLYQTTDGHVYTRKYPAWRVGNGEQIYSRKYPAWGVDLGSMGESVPIPTGGASILSEIPPGYKLVQNEAMTQAQIQDLHMSAIPDVSLLPSTKKMDEAMDAIKKIPEMLKTALMYGAIGVVAFIPLYFGTKLVWVYLNKRVGAKGAYDATRQRGIAQLQGTEE